MGSAKTKSTKKRGTPRAATGVAAKRGPGGGYTGEWFDDKGRMDVHDLMDEIRNYQLEYELWLANADVRDESALRHFLFQELS